MLPERPSPGWPALEQRQRCPPRHRRASDQNWFVVNDGTPLPAIVLGVSGYGREVGLLSVAACCLHAAIAPTVTTCLPPACHLLHAPRTAPPALRRSKPEELVHLEAAAAQHVPLIKRFTGGGTGACMGAARPA